MGTRFWRAFGAYSANAVGDEFYALALPLVLLQLGYSAATTTFLRAVLMATTVIAGFLVGHLVDRHAPELLLTRSYLGSALALGGALLAITAGLDSYLAALIAATVLGLLAAVSAAAMDAGIPRLVPAADLIPRGYSLAESARTSATIVGPMLAGLVATVRSIVLVIGANAVSFILAAALARTRRTNGPRVERHHSAWQQIAEGLRTVVRHRRLRLGIGLSLLVNITLGAEQPLFLARLIQDFGLSAALTAGVIVIAGVVAIVVSLGLSHWTTGLPARPTMITSVFVIALSAVGIGVVDTPWAAAPLYCLLSAATICYSVYWRTYRQNIVDPGLLGRVSATSRSIAYSGVVLGTVVVGTLQQSGVTTKTLLAAGGLLCTVGAIFGALALRRVRDDSPNADLRR